MHPAFSFPRPDLSLDRLRRLCFLLAGDRPAVGACRRLLTHASLRFVEAEGDLDGALYHAGCVVAANFPALLGEIAARLCAEAGVAPAGIGALVDSLMQSALANAREDGFTAALTGPVRRGDAITLQSDAEAVARRAPAFYPFFMAGNAVLAGLCRNSSLRRKLLEGLAAELARHPP